MPEKGQLNLMQVKFWQSEAKSCEERQKQELINRNHYPHLINYFEGVQQLDAKYPHVSAESKYLIISEYFPNTNELISELMYQNPDILLDALKPEAEEKVPLMKSALTYFFDKTEALVENRVALFDMLFAGYCAVEVDQMPVDTTKPATLKTSKPEPDNIIGKAVNAMKTLLNLDDVEESLAETMPAMEANYATVQGTYLRRYDPLDVPLDWRAERLRDRRYNLKKVWLSKAEFDVKYPDFKNQVIAEDKFSFGKHGLDTHNRKVLIYEFQVRLKDNKYQTIIISPNVNTRELDTFVRPYKTNGFNMKIGSLHKYGKLYPISIAQMNKTMSDELNHYVRHLMEVAERNIPKFVTDKNTVKTDAKDALKSNKVNDIVEVDGMPGGKIVALQPTVTSIENKELMSIFQDQKNKLWAVSEARISGRAQNEFATDSQIQEAGFKARQVDIQEGLRLLITEQLDTGKDLICNFWDDQIFLKVTGSGKQGWYTPQTAPNPNNPDQSMVLNPLTEQLKVSEDDESLGDYEVKVDIASASRPNRQQELTKMTMFMAQLVQIRQILIDQGKDINIDEIRRISKEFGWNPDKLFIDHQPAQIPTVPTAGGETISPNEDAKRQAMAQQMLQAKNGGLPIGQGH